MDASGIKRRKMTKRIVIANLDCEHDFARMRCPGPHKAIPSRIAAAIARASTSLAVFTRPGDALWTMAQLPPDPESQVELLSGDRCLLNDFDEILYWGQSEDAPRTQAENTQENGSWQESLWGLHCTPEIAADANDRRFCLNVASSEEYRLPGTTLIEGMSELDHYIASAPLGEGDAWVAKVPFSASGRDRVSRHGRLLQGEMRVRTERLLTRFGALLIEPWVPRIADYGECGIVGNSMADTCIFAPHRLYSDNTGVFRGIRIADSEVESELGPVFFRELNATAHAVATSLFEIGYRGPFGVDSFVYSDRAGNRRLQSLCEINARISFGLVARAHAELSGNDTFDFSLR